MIQANNVKFNSKLSEVQFIAIPSANIKYKCGSDCKNDPCKNCGYCPLSSFLIFALLRPLPDKTNGSLFNHFFTNQHFVHMTLSEVWTWTTQF